MSLPLLSIIQTAKSVEPTEMIYSLDSKPHGISYSEWTAKWHQWLMEIPADINPAADYENGKNCMVDQSGPVWFLAGTTGEGDATRTCEIPYGKDILFPIVAAECWEKNIDTDEIRDTMVLCAKSDNDPNDQLKLTATIDNVNFPQELLESYRVTSSFYEITYPQPNLYGMDPGHFFAVNDGYWVFVKALEKGTHKIEFFGHTDPASPGKEPFTVDVNYNITIR